MEVYSIRNVSFAFPESEVEALSNIQLTIHSGQFILLCGRSGCGKSTLLRQLKPALTPHGKRSGDIGYRGRPIAELDQRAQAAEIGFVLQNPDNGIVTDKVWHELAFGLESLGCDHRTIRLRVAEMASFFGIQGWFHRSVTELSGGQKQLLNLASIMAMQPSVLVLDEPTSQLDPIAASEFLDTLKKINQELGTTIIMSEHRLEEALPLADRLIVMEKGTVIVDDDPRNAGKALFDMAHPMSRSMPSPMRIHAGAGGEGAVPLTVKEGRGWLDAYTAEGRPDGEESTQAGQTSAGEAAAVEQAVGTETGWAVAEQIPVSATAFGLAPEKAAAVRRAAWRKTLTAVVLPSAPVKTDAPVAVSFKDVWFRYEKNGPDIIKDLSLEVRAGQFYCLVGGNGTGKTTALSLLNGILKPYRGEIRFGSAEGNSAKQAAKGKEKSGYRIGTLPQNPQSLFVKKTVELDLLEMLSDAPLTKEQRAERVERIVQFVELEPVLSMHPYDLSGGEQQRAALAKVLLLEPDILLLDEPTKGLDGFFKEKLAAFLKKLNETGVTIVMVSHDIEFCAQYGEVCSMLFDGSVAATDAAKPFFAGNSFYTTASNRMARHIWREGVTVEDVVELCRGSRV